MGWRGTSCVEMWVRREYRSSFCRFDVSGGAGEASEEEDEGDGNSQLPNTHPCVVPGNVRSTKDAIQGRETSFTASSPLESHLSIQPRTSISSGELVAASPVGGREMDRMTSEASFGARRWHWILRVSGMVYGRRASSRERSWRV